jgi:phage host-nuclease inhibitor protein Gam
MAKTSKATKPVTAKQYEDALQRYAQNERKTNVIIAKSEKKVQDELAKRKTAIGNMETEMETDFATIKQYCEENRKKVFGDEKSAETKYGIVGFRTGKHGLNMGEKSDKELIEAFKKKNLQLYIVTKEALDKNKIIADREDAKLTKVLDALEVKVEQNEAFFFKTN